MLRRLVFRIVGTVAFAATALDASAQVGQNALVVRAIRPDSVNVEGGAVVTTVFATENRTDDTLVVQSSLTLPKGWTAITGIAPFTLLPRATDTWLVSIAVPAATPAGRYVIRGAENSGAGGAADSVVVLVNERRAIELLPMEMPGWVHTGGRYEARFLVRNRGNVPASVTLSGTTSRGRTAVAEPSVVKLAPGASAPVTVRVALIAGAEQTSDDVIEVSAVDSADASVRADASARTTVVGNASLRNLRATIPGMLALRTIGGAAGVSPVVVGGAGRVDALGTHVDFFLQAPTSENSRWSLGEREEYRLVTRSDRYGTRLGHNLFGFSALTSSSMEGSGAEVTTQRGALRGGAYAQQLRWVPGRHNEQSAFVGYAPDSMSSASAIAMMRQSAHGDAVRVGGLSGSKKFGRETEIGFDAAQSDSAGIAGNAIRGRMSGVTQGFSYDAGVMRGSSQFAGPIRSNRSQHASLAKSVTTELTMSSSASVAEWGFGEGDTRIGQRFGIGNVAASWGSLGTLEYGWLNRRDESNVAQFNGTQRGLRATTTRDLGRVSATFGAERGVVNDQTSTHPYTQLSLSARTAVTSRGSIGFSGTHNKGSTLTGARDGVLNFGLNADAQLPRKFSVGVTSTAQRAVFGIRDSSGAWFSVTDIRVDRRFDDGSSLGLHARLLQTPSAFGSSGQSAAYFEYKRPLKIPAGPSRQRGRAQGRVTDAESGLAVSGVLVRMGDQVAVTDNEGKVFFAGLKPLRYPVSVEANGAVAGAMVVGDVMVDMKDAGTTVSSFAVAVTRGARVSASVHQYVPRATVGVESDSLTEVPPPVAIVVALQGARDTIYQTTDQKGRVDFGAVAPGAWTLVMRSSDAPELTKFERERIDVIVNPGELRDVEIRLLPRKRTVTFTTDVAPLTAKQKDKDK